MITFRQPFQKEWPITQRYGEKLTSAFHTGIDYGCPLRTTILASADGTVLFAGWDRTGYGNMVIIQHASNRATLYAHLSLISVKIGEKVRQGEKIGESGTTGNSTGPHLHFEVRTVWNDPRTHMDPFLLPLMSANDEEPPLPGLVTKLDAGTVRIAAPAGAWGHDENFSSKKIFPLGTLLEFTGTTVERNGYTFCKCVPLPSPVWIAVHDNETQILENV